MKLYFITSNTGKAHEAKKKLAPLGYDLVQRDLPCPEIQADSLEDVVRFSADYLAEKIDGPFFLEDAGLFIASLSGFPGVYSHYVYETIGCDGVLKLLDGTKKRNAHFKAVIAYRDEYTGTEKENAVVLFSGVCEGVIAAEKRGASGFGFDPIFIPDRSEKTFAEMTAEEKNTYSHRGKALEKFTDFLEKKS